MNPLSHHTRYDVLTGQTVIIAAEREQRPVPLQSHTAMPVTAHDPFLEGEESDTPSERLALRQQRSAADQPGWLVRVVPNRYPAVIQAGPPPTTAQPHNRAACTNSATAAVTEVSAATAHNSQKPQTPAPLTGFHDVVIECPDHRTRLTQMTVVEVTRVLIAWQQRVLQLQQDGRFTHVRIFRNQGATAGASLPHCHSQIVATQLADESTRQPLWQSAQDPDSGENPVYKRWKDEELASAERIVRASEELLVVCPFASRFSWHVRLCPGPQTCSQFETMTVAELTCVAAHLHALCGALEQIAPDVGMNLNLILPSRQTPTAFPWMLDVLPRPGRIAGFELMTGVQIVTVTPETAARQYQDAADWAATDVALRAITADHITPPDYQWRTTDRQTD